MKRWMLAAIAAMSLVGCRAEVETDRRSESEAREDTREALNKAERDIDEAGEDINEGAKEAAEDVDEAVGGSGDDNDRR
jgi:hypothetical protein